MPLYFSAALFCRTRTDPPYFPIQRLSQTDYCSLHVTLSNPFNSSFIFKLPFLHQFCMFMHIPIYVFYVLVSFWEFYIVNGRCCSQWTLTLYFGLSIFVQQLPFTEMLPKIPKTWWAPTKHMWVDAWTVSIYSGACFSCRGCLTLKITFWHPGTWNWNLLILCCRNAEYIYKSWQF